MKHIFALPVLLLFVLLFGCSSDIKTTELIEAYTIENLADRPNHEGIIEKNGYRKVNSIVLTEESRRSEKLLKFYEVADFHNLVGKFVYSEISYSDTQKNSNQKIVNKPMTILTPDIMDPVPAKDLTAEEKQQVKEHVSHIMATVLEKDMK